MFICVSHVLISYIQYILCVYSSTIRQVFSVSHVFMYLNIVFSKCLISVYFCLFTANVFVYGIKS